MRRTTLICVLLSAVVLCVGCGTGMRNAAGGDAVKTLIIRWQRLVNDEGKTCDRCGNTEQEVNKAAESLSKSLGPLGIRVTLVQKTLNSEECKKDISESNRIWVADRPLEDWLGAGVGMSPCSSCCSELGETVECRTVSVDGRTYETIPAELIVRAGLVAASEILEAPSTGECCPDARKATGKNGKCCP